MKYLFLVSVFPFIFSFVILPKDYEILTSKDWEYMRESSHSPALSSTLQAKVQWKSYNEWQCFDANEIDLDFETVDYNGIRKIPTIFVMQIYPAKIFDLSPETNWRSVETLNYWKELVEGSSSVCIFAAYLQTDEKGTPDEFESWVIEDIKTRKGYWSSDDEEMQLLEEE